MKTMKVLTAGLLLTTAAALMPLRPALGCDECKGKKSGTTLGDQTILGNGTARTWVTLKDGKPVALGVTLSETALTGLPENVTHQEHTMSLPKQVNVAPFDHIQLDWNPKGHEPANVYDKPHFDIHFYTITREQQAKITATGKDAAIAVKKPDAKFIPAGYILPPIPALPRMGAHWIDPKSPEFNKEPFTNTFLYGTYNGKMAFWEPMITKAYLETKPDVRLPVAQPGTYEVPGYYPTHYSVRYDAQRKEYTIALEGLTYRSGVPAAVKPQQLTKRK